MTSSTDILVIGAGVLGLSVAAELARRGREVRLVDPGGTNASSVAAGMIAPAMESALETVDLERAALLRRARDLWPDFAAAAGIHLHREGAERRGPDAQAVGDRLAALGFAVERRASGVFTPDDWRVEPEAALAALAATPGVSLERARATALVRDGAAWRVEAQDGRDWRAGQVVAATGPGPGLAAAPAAVRRLETLVSPIRGQIVFVGQTLTDHAVRGPAAYAVPTRGGTLIGATMEAGVRTLEPDPGAGEAQVRAGLALLGLPDVLPPFECRVGVRGAAPDGLPLAGPLGEGLHAALAPRRNGWLLGPLVAAVVADGIEGRRPEGPAAALDPARFG